MFVFNGSTAAHTLPYTVIGPQATGGMAYPWMPNRIRWVSPSAGATDAVIVKDNPGIPTAATAQRIVYESLATGAAFKDDTRPYEQEQYVGMVITQMDSGTLFVYL